MLHKVEPISTLCNMLVQLATLKFVARQVEHAIVIRVTTRSTSNATMLRDKLNKNVARINGPLYVLFCANEHSYYLKLTIGLGIFI